MDRPRILILILACAAAGCTGGSSNNGPVPRLMAYTRYFPGERAAEVWTADLDGGGACRLVRGIAPSVSPDGRWVAFLRCGVRDPYCNFYDLYVIGSGGGTARLLAREAYAPVWSSDSDRIVAYGEISIVTEALVNIDVESGRRVEIARGSLHGWSFAPSGDEVVYGRGSARCPSCRWGERVNLYVVGAEGGEPRRLTHDGESGFPVWGPGAIAFSRGLPYRGWGRDEIWLIDPNGGNRRTLSGAFAEESARPGYWGLETDRFFEERQ